MSQPTLNRIVVGEARRVGSHTEEEVEVEEVLATRMQT